MTACRESQDRQTASRTHAAARTRPIIECSARCRVADGRHVRSCMYCTSAVYIDVHPTRLCSHYLPCCTAPTTILKTSGSRGMSSLTRIILSFLPCSNGRVSWSSALSSTARRFRVMTCEQMCGHLADRMTQYRADFTHSLPHHSVKEAAWITCSTADVAAFR